MADVDPAIQAAEKAFNDAWAKPGGSFVAIEAVVAAARPIVERECYTRAAEAIEAADLGSGGDIYDEGRNGYRDGLAKAAELVRGLAGLHGQEHG